MEDKSSESVTIGSGSRGVGVLAEFDNEIVRRRSLVASPASPRLSVCVCVGPCGVDAVDEKACRWPCEVYADEGTADELKVDFTLSQPEDSRLVSFGHSSVSVGEYWGLPCAES